MKHVIIGVGAAGITAAETLRKERPDDEIFMISEDNQVHSRCMLHYYLAHERTAEQLDFTPEGFFEKNKIYWTGGQRVQKLDLNKKEIVFADDIHCDYDKLLIATGAESFIPPVGALRTADNVFGLRHLKDAVAIDEMAKKAQKVVIVGSGLVGLDAAYGLIRQKKDISIVEMADRILPIQMDEKGAAEYQRRFEEVGCKFYLSRKGSDTIVGEDNKITHLVLDDGQKLECDMIIVAAGVRAAVGGFEDSGLVIDRGIKVDGHMRTSDPHVYAAGDVAGISGTWPNAMKQGKIAAQNMAGGDFMYVDPFSAKNTMNFFGLVSLCVGELKAQEGDEVLVKECKDSYKRAIIRDNKLVGFILQGDISHSGIYQYMIKNGIDISGIKEHIFAANFGDFYSTKENGEYLWSV